MQSWHAYSPDSDFSIYNIPFGIFSTALSSPRIGSRIGDTVIDLGIVATLGLFDDLNIPTAIWRSDVLNPFIALGKTTTNAVRTKLQDALSDESSVLREHTAWALDIADVTMHMPVHVGDYTDFYSSRDHATNVGKMFRDPDNALLPNWLHLPVGYHGRASSIVVSGQPLHRPHGQLKPADGPPVFGPCNLLDFELEMAFIVGKENTLGAPIPMAEAKEYLFGMVVFNDWSARDIQKWEYVPLGPFLGKNFGSSISPWIVTMEALEMARTSGEKQAPEPLPYLRYQGNQHYDIALEVDLTTAGGVKTNIVQSNFRRMYWTMCQQLVHHTVNGCNVRIGDMMASGTISGPDRSSFGSMLELSWGGKQEIALSDGSTRKFVQDGDSITMRGFVSKEGKRVGFGEVSTEILPAKEV